MHVIKCSRLSPSLIPRPHPKKQEMAWSHLQTFSYVLSQHIMGLRWKGDDAANVLGAVHGIWTDSQKSIYVAEIGTPENGQRVRKYQRI